MQNELEAYKSKPNISNENVIQNSKEKMKQILASLYKAKSINQALQEYFMTKFNKTQKEFSFIEELLDKAKRLTKSKPKKHIRYSSYIPLEKVYFYTTKKIHLYYHLLDRVTNTRKKPQHDEMVIPKKDSNRYSFTKEAESLLTNFLFLSVDPSINWYQCADKINEYYIRKQLPKEANYSPLQCYVRHLETSSFYKYKKWTNDEDSILKKAILYYGPKNWQQISYCLDGRNNSQCFHRWMKGINPKIKRDKWTYIEDLTLGIALTKIYGFKKWSKIANHLPGRTDIQCRERWCNILDPSLEEVEWTKEEDMKLLNLNRIHGNKWSRIAKEYGNRTDNTCWRRWKFLTSSICQDKTQNNESKCVTESKILFLVNKGYDDTNN